jgi:phosphate transport system permease protein
MANEDSTQLETNVVAGIDLKAHAQRIEKQNHLATVILTVIVGFVLLLLASIVIYILVQGLPKVFTPGFLT